MIDLQDIMTKVAECKMLIEDKLSHFYLQKHITAPSVDTDKLLLLYTIYSDLQVPEEKVQNYVITTMLVQLALDTHETVPNTTVYANEHFKNQQLTVLAGDYYSGLYYYFLAQTDDILLIRTLAEGIKDVNENKIILYQKDSEQVDSLITCIESIETAIIKNVFSTFHINKFESIASKFLLLKRLIQEREIYMSKGYSILFESLRKILYPKLHPVNKEPLGKDQETYLLHVYNSHVEKVGAYIDKVLHANPNINQILLERMKSLLYHNGLANKKAVEEG